MKRVLIVDDDASIREIIEMVLSSEGYQVATAQDGEAALEAIRQSPPDVILLDIKMPVMSGSEFAEAYRRTPGPHAPVVVVTAAQFAEQRAAEIHADGYLGKPFDLDELLAVVGRFSAGV